MLMKGGPWAIVAISWTVIAFLYRSKEALNKEVREQERESARQAVEDARSDRAEMAELMITTRNAIDSLKTTIDALRMAGH